MFCFKCGASMPDDSKVCPQCATPVQAVPAPPAAAPPQPSSAWLNVPPTPQQYPPQGQPYQGQQYPGQQYQPPQTEGKATASLVLGILSLLCFGFLAGIPAIILGHISRSNIKKSNGRVGGGGMALAGLIMGYVSIAFSLLIIPAIMIPNLLRARMVANEAAAASTVRTINTSQVTYATRFPEKAYAPDLATLGPGPTGCAGEGTAEHACLLDNQLGASRCTAGAWCAKSGYNYSLSREGSCGTEARDTGSGECNYVIVATPVSTATGRRSYCSISDAVIRSQYTSTISTPISATECAAWSPITD